MEKSNSSNKIAFASPLFACTQKTLVSNDSSCNLCLDLLGGNSSFSETILEATGKILDIRLTTRSSSSTSLALFRPFESSNLGSRESTRRTCALLDVVRTTSATSAESVGFVVLFTEGLCSLCHLIKKELGLQKKEVDCPHLEPVLSRRSLKI